MLENKLRPGQGLNKAFLKVSPHQKRVAAFSQRLIKLMAQVNEAESEEFHKNLLSDFLKATDYSPQYFINTKGRNDLVIHTGKTAKTAVGVIIEAKRPINQGEMPKVDNLNTKALQELVLYFLRERITENNLELKYLVITNVYEWFIFDAKLFDRLFAQDRDLVKKFNEFEQGQLSGDKTDFFYKEIAKPAIAAGMDQIKFTHFDLRDYGESLRGGDKGKDGELVALFKVLSPEHLLKLPFANDSNRLNKPFYNELLYIIGLAETKSGGKKVIGRVKEGDRRDGSLIENAIGRLDSLGKISRLTKPEGFGDADEEKLFNVALRLSINWINRILFLKLLEAQLIKYHQGNRDFAFLNLQKVKDYDDLESLFFDVLAREPERREARVKDYFANVPYLNSSLFEPTETEQETIFISNLQDRCLPIFGATVLKDGEGKRRSGELNALQYLFEFLDAYDFSSDESEDNQEDSEKLINAAVLGLIFEKINGYKDGSFYTPSFITMYVCRETIRRAIVQKFNEVKGWHCQNLDDLYEKIEDKQEANQIINSLKICDPAVGSGHFLVSALNEMIAIKSELKILLDRASKSLKDYRIEVKNDKLLVYDDEGNLFAYRPNNAERQRVQEALFYEKKTIIEGCLFGVDSNPNSVTICRLRLWIELLKNAYYRADGNLETLPNIDINIKCGNSLISRFPLDLKVVSGKSKVIIEVYRQAVRDYQQAKDKGQKREVERLIEEIKGTFRTTLTGQDPNKTKLRNLEGELYQLENQVLLFEESAKEKKAREKKVTKLSNEIDKLKAEIEEIESGRLYYNALEWRFEFPDVLNDQGDFVGFDVVIGNPPYVPSKNLDEIEKALYYENFKTTEYQINTFGIFTELSIQILRQKALLGLIIPNYWLTTKYDKKLRNFLFKQNKTISIINIYGIFESAVVETLLLFSKKEKGDNKINIFSIDRNLSMIDKRLEAVMNSKWSYSEKIDILSLNQDLTISFENEIKISSEVLIGYLFDLKFGAKLYEVGKGNPSQTKDDSKNKIYESNIQINDKYIKLLRARDIRKYKINIDNYYVKYGENLAAPRSISLFEGERILVQRIFSKEKLDAAYANEVMICNTDVITLKPKNNMVNVKFYLAIVCSKLCALVLKSQNVNLDRNAFPKINTATLSTFPVPKYKHQYAKITSIVDQILSANKHDPNADTNQLEKEIDHLVYKLYQLTYDEVKIIDPSFELTPQQYANLKIE